MTRTEQMETIDDVVDWFRQTGNIPELRERIRHLIEDEREACARFIEEYTPCYYGDSSKYRMAEEIRRRGA